MDWLQILQILANIATIIGVIVVLVSSGKATIQAAKDFLKQRRPIRKPSASTVRNILLGLLILVIVSFRSLPIFNLASASTSPKETLTFSLTEGLNGATTRQSYTGTTTITVSGTGQAFNQEFSDAFYVYTIGNGQTMVTGYRVTGFSLCIDYQPVD